MIHFGPPERTTSVQIKDKKLSQSVPYPEIPLHVCTYVLYVVTVAALSEAGFGASYGLG
jgi:hypothetical protein